jgi:SAM-dependent methyltransferase
VRTIDPWTEPPDQAVCPACARRRRDTERVWQVETPRGTNPWTRCSHCTAYFLISSYDLDAEVAHTETLPWGQLQAGLDLNVFKHRMFTAVLRRLADYHPPPASILDVGCSFGGFGIEATRAGYEVYGMDITPAAVEYVKSLGLEAECCSAADELRGIPSESLDVVSCLDCHGLWPDQPSQLRAIHGKLKPGGVLVMRVVDKSWLFTIGRHLIPLSPRLASRVMREAVNDNRFSMPAHSLRHQLAEQGFEVEATLIWEAIHSDRTRWLAKASFALGAALWPVVHRNYAPGALLIAKRRSTE